MARDPERKKVLALNRKARFEYEILDEVECGLVLRGTEVKSLRQGGGSIAEAYALVRAGELWLVNSHIPEYAQGNIHNHVPTRERKLLVHRKEIARWDRQVREKGVTMVPLELFFKGHLVKLRLGLARGKKLHDKREAKRRDEARREIDRAVARRR